MKKIVVAVFVALLTLLMLFSLTSLVKANNKVPATVDYSNVQRYLVPGETMTTPSGIVQVRGMELDFTSGYVLHFGGNDYPMYSYNIMDEVYNPKTQVVMWRSDAIWYMSPGSLGSANGFAGNIETKLYGVTSLPITGYTGLEAHCALQGFGTFAGMTLVLSFQPGDLYWSGFVIIH